MPVHYMNGIEVQVPEDTVFVLNPTTLSLGLLHVMKGMKFHMGGIISVFQTKLQLSYKCFRTRLSHLSNHSLPLLPSIHYEPVTIFHEMEEEDLEEEEGFGIY